MFSPQLADYDGDGRIDLVSGSTCCQHPYCFYVFHRRQDGRFAERRRVNLNIPGTHALEFGNGLKSKVAIADWNGDGAADVLVGAGRDWFLGLASGPLAGKDELTVQPLWPKGKQPLGLTTNPCLADWDADGLLDLIVGGYRGRFYYERQATGVYWLRNVGTRHKPKLAAPKQLVATKERDRLRGLCVADWNGDDRLDLIVSRFEYEGVPQPDWRKLRRNRIWVYLRSVP